MQTISKSFTPETTTLESSSIHQDSSSFVWILSSVAALSGFLFGYDTSVVAAALVNIKNDLGSPLSSNQAEWIVSSTSVGALIGALASGWFGKYGRKRMMALGDVFFVLGAIIVATSHSIVQIIIGRIILGFGVGIASSTAPLYIAELSPTHRRTSLITIQTVAITLGQLVSYAIGAGLTFPGGWRISFALSVVPALVQAAYLKWLPESPVYNMMNGMTAEARETFRRIYKTGSEAQIDIFQQEAQDAIDSTRLIQSKSNSFKRLFITRWKPTIIAIGAMSLQQFCGFNSLNYYSATLFSFVGFQNPTAVGLIVSGTNFIFTVVALYLFTRGIGKRKLLLVTIPGMILGLSLSAIAFSLITKKTGGILLPGAQEYPIGYVAMMLGSIVIFIMSYALGIGNVAWNSVELFELSVRGLGASILAATNWTGNIIVSSTFLTLLTGIGAARAFSIYAIVCLIGFIFIYFCYPETKGIGLDQIDLLFQDGSFGVKKADELRRDGKLR